MAYHNDVKKALIKWLGKDNVVFYPGWDKQQRGIGWAKNGVPVGLMAHHTAGAATDSTDPKNPGNSRKADKPQADYVNNAFSAPAANFTLGRSGTLFVHSVYPCWHSGKGTFKGKPPYDTLGVPADKYADYGMGVEVVSKGLKQDFLAQQKWALGRLTCALQEASWWAGFKKRLPNHKTWAGPRKIDTRYSETTLIKWAENAKKKGPAG